MVFFVALGVIVFQLKENLDPFVNRLRAIVLIPSTFLLQGKGLKTNN
jgi:hypothetical protein